MSDKAIEQRRANQPKATEASRELSTGPITEDGKAASSRNGWIHGRYSAINRAQFGLGAASMAKMFGKPCVTTCPYHPQNPERTEAPCSLVLDGLTHAGGSCLDKTVYVQALGSLMEAMQNGEMDGMHGLLAKELASNLQVLDQVRQAIADLGVMVKTYVTDKFGGAVLDPNGQPIVQDVKVNPALLVLAKFSDTLGLNFAELMATPRAREKLKDEDDAASGLASAIGAIFGRANKRIGTQRPVIEHDDA
ncbi:MAG: hypothetical protein P4L92_23105 [Rudaea sp.]|nr:hypothetical protein [Rudaea sp.]